jgi:hypothetical protein
MALEPPVWTQSEHIVDPQSQYFIPLFNKIS